MYLYILQSLITKTHYVGITNDLEKRLSYHNQGKVFSTKNKKPWKIIYSENVGDFKEAREREKYLKSYKGVREKREIIKKYSGIVPGRA